MATFADCLGMRALSNVKIRIMINHWMHAKIYGLYAVMSKIPFETSQQIIALEVPMHNKKPLNHGFIILQPIRAVEYCPQAFTFNNAFGGTALWGTRTPMLGYHLTLCPHSP